MEAGWGRGCFFFCTEIEGTKLLRRDVVHWLGHHGESVEFQLLEEGFGGWGQCVI